METKSRRKRGTKSGQDGDTARQESFRAALRANAAFSGVSGVAIAAASPVLPALLGAGTTTLYVIIGVFLVAFALRLALLVRAESVPRSEALIIVAGDWGWVVGSAVVIGMGLLTTVGAVLVGVTALVVGSFAVWQGRSLPRDGL